MLVAQTHFVHTVDSAEGRGHSAGTIHNATKNITLMFAGQEDHVNIVKLLCGGVHQSAHRINRQDIFGPESGEPRQVAVLRYESGQKKCGREGQFTDRVDWSKFKLLARWSSRNQ